MCAELKRTPFGKFTWPICSILSSTLLLVNSVDEFGFPQFDCQSNVSLNSNIVVVGACAHWLDEGMNGRMNGCCFLIGLLTVTAQNIV